MVDGVNEGGGSDRLAPVIPLFGAAPRSAAPTEEARDRPKTSVSFGPLEPEEDHDDPSVASPSADPAEVRAHAERTLLKKLRARSLSLVEARRVLAQTDIDRVSADELIDEFLRRGYLDDAVLAEQLVHAGSERKAQGRKAISLTLSQRGIPRDIADAAIADLPDDDAERAREFARTKARSLDRVDDEAAYRRLVGALSRRGYGGSVASDAARTALAERRAERSGSTGGVRFR